MKRERQQERGGDEAVGKLVFQANLNRKCERCMKKKAI